MTRGQKQNETVFQANLTSLPICSSVLKKYPSSSTKGEYSSYTGAKVFRKQMKASLVNPVIEIIAWSSAEVNPWHYGLVEAGNNDMRGILFCLMLWALLLSEWCCLCLLYDKTKAFAGHLCGLKSKSAIASWWHQCKKISRDDILLEWTTCSEWMWWQFCVVI